MGVMTEETSYGVMSLDCQMVIPQRLLSIVRGDLGIENQLRYRRDVTLHKDQSRVRLKQAPQVMSALNNFTPNLLAWSGFVNISQERRHLKAQLPKGGRLAHSGVMLTLGQPYYFDILTLTTELIVD